MKLTANLQRHGARGNALRLFAAAVIAAIATISAPLIPASAQQESPTTTTSPSDDPGDSTTLGTNSEGSPATAVSEEIEQTSATEVQVASEAVTEQTSKAVTLSRTEVIRSTSVKATSDTPCPSGNITTTPSNLTIGGTAAPGDSLDVDLITIYYGPVGDHELVLHCLNQDAPRPGIAFSYEPVALTLRPQPGTLTPASARPDTKITFDTPGLCSSPTARGPLFRAEADEHLYVRPDATPGTYDVIIECQGTGPISGYSHDPISFEVLPAIRSTELTVSPTVVVPGQEIRIQSDAPCNVGRVVAREAPIRTFFVPVVGGVPNTYLVHDTQVNSDAAPGSYVAHFDCSSSDGSVLFTYDPVDIQVDAFPALTPAVITPGRARPDEKVTINSETPCLGKFFKAQEPSPFSSSYLTRWEPSIMAEAVVRSDAEPGIYSVTFECKSSSHEVMYSYEPVEFTVLAEASRTCRGEAATIDMNTNGGDGTGTDGRDVIIGTPGDDVIDGGPGDDLICGSDGDDIINGGPGADVLSGDGGNDELQGLSGIDTLDGGPGNDILRGNSEMERLAGDGGRDQCETELQEICEDSLAVPHPQDLNVSFDLSDNSDVTASIEFQTSTCVDTDAFRSDSLGVSPAWTIAAPASGALCPASGSGSETVSVAVGSYQPGNHTIYLNGEAFEFTIAEPEPAVLCDGKPVTIDMNTNGGNGYGTPGPDVILGTPGNDVISGFAGDDLICGGEGADRINGGAGADRILGGAGADQLQGREGNDFIYGNHGNDTILAGAGNDWLLGGPGSDILFGQADIDVVVGEDGNDRLYGGVGNDRLFGGLGTDKLSGGAGDDFLSGSNGADHLRGQGGNDRLYGGPGPDIGKGGNGDDWILGEGGDDVLYGQAGADKIFGGGGHDTITGGTDKDHCQGEVLASCE